MKSEMHLRFIRGLDCIIPGCGDNVTVEAAHVRYADARAGKTEMGMGRRDDRWVVPLCHNHHLHHREGQHAGSERGFWQRQGLDPVVLASWLWSAHYDHETGMKIIYAARTEHRAGYEEIETKARWMFDDDQTWRAMDETERMWWRHLARRVLTEQAS